MRPYILFALFFICASSYAEKLPTSGTLLWRVSGNGLTENSYLYGTMHTRDNRVFRFSDSVLNCFIRCKAFAMELKLDELNQEDVINNMMMDSGKSIENYLTKNQYDSLQLKIQSVTGLPLNLFERLKPIYIATMLSQSEMLYDTMNKNSYSLFLDEYFELMAKNSGKKVAALEALQTQLDVFNFLSIKQQIDLLMKSIRKENNELQIDTFVNHYINGELEILLKNDNNELWSAEFMNKILYRRNFGMADNIESLIKKQSTFSAFGAAHLTGDSGIISILRTKGYTVEPVNAYYNDLSKEGWLYVYPNNIISVSMPGIPEYKIDSSQKSKVAYYQWASHKSNSYKVAHFDKSAIVNKSLLEEFVENEFKTTSHLVRAKNQFVNRRNIKTYYLNKESANGFVFFIENGNAKIVAIVFNEHNIDIDELNKFISLIRYKISSVIPN